MTDKHVNMRGENEGNLRFAGVEVWYSTYIYSDCLVFPMIQATNMLDSAKQTHARSAHQCSATELFIHRRKIFTPRILCAPTAQALTRLATAFAL